MSAAGSPARSVSPVSGSLKVQTQEPRSQTASDSVEPTPLVLPQEVSEALSNWLTKGVSTDESKAISKRTPLEFADKKFFVRPPKRNGYMYRGAKDKGKLKILNASEESLITKQLKIMGKTPHLLIFIPTFFHWVRERRRKKLKTWYRMRCGSGRGLSITSHVRENDR